MKVIRPRFFIIPASIGLLSVSAAFSAERPVQQIAAEQMGLLRAEFSPVRLQAQPEGKMQAVFTLEGEPVTIDLTPHRVRSPDFKVFTTDANGQRQEVELPPETTYRGRIPDMPEVKIAASICDGKLTALMRDKYNRYWVVEPAVDGAPAGYAVYQAQDVQSTPAECATRVKPSRSAAGGTPQPPMTAAAGGGGEQQVNAAPGTAIAEIAFDTDYEFYQTNSYSVAATVADIENVMNGVNLIYENDVGITHQINSINVRTNSGAPYTSTNHDILLDQMEAEWKANFVGVPRDIAHLMTGKEIDGSTIGLAYIGAICDDDGPWGFGYGFSQSKYSSNFQNRIGVTAHELGHNWDANHDSGGNIMCAFIGGCSGIINSFAATAISAITSHRDSRTCLDYVPDVLPDLVVTKTVDQDPVVVTDFLQYTITVTNAGTTNATGVIITDVLPDGLSFVGSTPSTGMSVNGQELTYTVGSLNVGASFTLLITAAADTLGLKSNTASAEANESDLVESNNEDEVTSEVVAALAIQESELTFTGGVGGPYSPTCSDINLSNRLSSSIGWQIITSPAWLDLSATSNALSGNSVDTLSACLNSSADLLPSGNYIETIVFSNDTTGLTQDLSVTLTLDAAAGMPFSEDFETGVLEDYWTATGTGDSRIQVTSLNGPDAGSYHVTLDDSTPGGFTRNELTLTINLTDYTNVVLSYRGRDFNDEAHYPSGPFTDGDDFDGIAISEDGVTWYPITDFTPLSSFYQSFQFNLDQAIATNGLSYNNLFKIRFNQYDNHSIGSDGVALDNITISGELIPDIDGDGIPNEWELQYFGGNTNATATADDDGDGELNINEYIADTNPTSAVSFLRFYIAPLVDGNVELSYLGSTGRVYSIYCRTNTLTGPWVQIQTNEFGTGSLSTFLPDTLPHCGIYRLEVALPPNP